MGSKRSALVVGGGIIGVTSAYVLARNGWTVQIIEREDSAAMGASRRNGRQLSYSHTNALAAPERLAHIPRYMLGLDDAFRLSMRIDTKFLRWSAQFLRNCTSRAYRHNTLAVLALAEESRRAMEALLSRHDIAFERRACGKMVLLHDIDAMRMAQSSLRMKQAAGLDQSLLNPGEAIEIEPALAPIRSSFAGALYSPGDETGDCQLFTTNLLKLLKTQYGVEFLSRRSVERIELARGKPVVRLKGGDALRGDLAIVANGHQADRLLAPIGHRAPVEAMKGYSFTAPLGRQAPLVSITDQARRIVFTNTGDRMLVAGIAELGRVDASIDQERLASMVAAARSSLPDAAQYEAIGDRWAGMRPATPNSQPVTQMLEPGLAVNVGHGMLGWTLAMGSAERLGRAVCAFD